MPPRRPNIPIGNRPASLRRLEAVLDAVQAIEQSARAYADAIARIRPSAITPEAFADVQAGVEDWYECQRRAAQLLYDLAAEIVRDGVTPARHPPLRIPLDD